MLPAGLVAPKTPHRFRPRTPESASPLGEGEERRDLYSAASERACWRGDSDRKTLTPGSRPGQAPALSLCPDRTHGGQVFGDMVDT